MGRGHLRPGATGGHKCRQRHIGMVYEEAYQFAGRSGVGSNNGYFYHDCLNVVVVGVDGSPTLYEGNFPVERQEAGENLACLLVSDILAQYGEDGVAAGDGA